ncbi:tetratricopeptide repeat protein [Candidatus Margulisiibacteriota bacterium]
MAPLSLYANLTTRKVAQVSTVLANEATRIASQRLAQFANTKVGSSLITTIAPMQAYLRGLRVQGLTNNGNLFAKSGYFKKATLQFDEALKSDPRYALAWIGKAAALNALGLTEEADRYSEEVKRLSEEAELLHIKILTTYKYASPEIINRLCDEIIKLSPKHVKARAIKGALYYNEGLLEEALEQFEQVRQIDPHDTSTRTLRETTLLLLEGKEALS